MEKNLQERLAQYSYEEIVRILSAQAIDLNEQKRFHERNCLRVVRDYITSQWGRK